MSKVKLLHSIIADELSNCKAFIMFGQDISVEELEGFAKLSKLVKTEQDYEDYQEAIRLYDKYKVDKNKVDLAVDGYEKEVDDNDKKLEGD